MILKGPLVATDGINNTMKLTYYDIELSTVPFINPSGGTFKLLYDNNIGDIQINSNNGLLTFSKLLLR